MKSYHRITNRDIEKILAHCVAGKRQKDAAAAIGCAQDTVSYWSRKLGLYWGRGAAEPESIPADPFAMIRLRTIMENLSARRTS